MLLQILYGCQRLIFAPKSVEKACICLRFPDDGRMKRLITILSLALSLATGGLFAAAKNNGPFIAIHPEGNQSEGQRMVRPETVGGKTRWFRISPEVSGRHFGSYSAFPAEDGVSYGAVLYLNDEGARSIQVLCSTFQGKLARIIVNGKPVELIRIDRAPQDRKVVIWSGLTAADFKAFDKSGKMTRAGGEAPR